MTSFPPLPHPTTVDGEPRRCGVEVEFSGLDEDRVARIVTEQLGGHPERVGPHEIRINDTRIGRVTVELDTRLAKYADTGVIEAGLDMARNLIPTELITDPLDPANLPQVTDICTALRDAGGEGTTRGPLRGFGVHLNIEVVAPDAVHTRRSILAFALLEPWLRVVLPPDATRRLMPFVEPWPASLVDALVATPDASLSELRNTYAAHVKSRNHGLDLLPLFKDADPDGYARDFPALTDIAARPAFHFRLPDCRLDDPDWSLRDPWIMWRAVEALADAPALLQALCDAWPEHRENLLRGPKRWSDRVSEVLAQGEGVAS